MKDLEKSYDRFEDIQERVETFDTKKNYEKSIPFEKMLDSPSRRNSKEKLNFNKNLIVDSQYGNTKFLVNNEDSKSYTQKLETDTYLLNSLIFSIFMPCFLLLITLFLKSIYNFFLFLIGKTDKDHENHKCTDHLNFIIKTFLGIFIMLFLVTIFTLPGIFVILCQILCINEIMEKELKIRISDELSLSFRSLKLCLILILGMNICQEISQSFNTIVYLLSFPSNEENKSVIIRKRTIKENQTKTNSSYFQKNTILIIISYIISVSFPIIQIIVAICLFSMSITVILDVSKVLELVQNFAGLYVVLEFDNIMQYFINILPWKTFLKAVLVTKVRFKNFDIGMEQIIKDIGINNDKINDIIENEEIVLDYSNLIWYYQVLTLKIVVILICVAIPLWIYL